MFLFHTGFTLLAAAGPFTTSDSLEMEPLKDLLRVVERERPNVLLLVCVCVHVCVCVCVYMCVRAHDIMFFVEYYVSGKICYRLQLGPFVDSTHPHIKVYIAKLQPQHKTVLALMH